MDSLNQKFAQNAINIIKASGTNIGFVEQVCEILPGNISRVANGRIRKISLENAYHIAKVIGLTIEEIVNYEE